MIEEKIDRKKEERTLGAIVDEKIEALIEIINETNDKMYKNFNAGMNNLLNITKQSEAELSKGTTLLWGIVNEANIRTAAIESVLLKNGMKVDDINEEIKILKDQMKQNGWQEMPLNAPSSPPEGELAPLS